ncbi:MAG: hypothetical protein ACRDFS_03610 [Chloroflexota bacterium]
MLAGLNILIFLKLSGELSAAAEHAFGALQSSYEEASDDEYGGAFYQARGMGFEAALFANQGDVYDSEFAGFEFALAITSNFWCVELGNLELEGELSEYFARQLAFDLDVETATEILMETNEDAEIFEIRVFRRNPQYRLDQGPTTPRVFVVETRQVEEPFDEDEEEPL